LSHRSEDHSRDSWSAIRGSPARHRRGLAFHAGEVKRSPPVFQRLAMEPRRLFKRYFTYNSLFLYHLLRDPMRG
jgi:hypothetical protein